jgi:hypothetical protein
MPLGIPREEIAAGMAYPGNRLPTFISTHEATGHAAAFPVGLPGFFINAYSDKGDLIFDPFMGSGSTLIAAEHNNRIGYGTEISPAYVEMTIMRWERVTGRKATLDGKTLEQVAKARRKGRAQGATDEPAKGKPASVRAPRARPRLAAARLAPASDT